MSKSSDPKPAIEVKGITKTFKIPLDKGRSVKSKILGRAGKGYREFTPLNDISFTVYEGDFFGIVGRNGSGKSTLLKTIAGIYEPTAGRVKVNGTLVPFIELGVGFNKNLSGRENVYLNAAMLGFSRSEIDDMYDDIVDFAELHDFMEERLQNYSSGMQVRLAFSIAIKAQGDILLLDEVLAVGDSAFQQKCYDYFEQLKKEKKTVILVTHSMTNVERFCNRGLLLNEGRIEAIGSSEEIAGKYRELFQSPPGPTVDNAASDDSKIEIVSGSIVQDGQAVAVVERDKMFTIALDMKLLDTDYTAHNVSVHIRNKFDVSVAFMTTTSQVPGCFDVDGDRFRVEFTIDDNIYNNGQYYVDVSARSAKQDRKIRETILNLKQVMRFEINNPDDRKINSMTFPSTSVSLDGVTIRDAIWDKSE